MSDEEPEFTWEHVDAAMCMWEHVLVQFGKKNRDDNPWLEHAVAYGRTVTREAVIRHAVELQAAYCNAVANGYNKHFDWDFVPKYMEDHVTRILT